MQFSANLIVPKKRISSNLRRLRMLLMRLLRRLLRVSLLVDVVVRIIVRRMLVVCRYLLGEFRWIRIVG
jgi:hypothetical protein